MLVSLVVSLSASGQLLTQPFNAFEWGGFSARVDLFWMIQTPRHVQASRGKEAASSRGTAAVGVDRSWMLQTPWHVQASRGKQAASLAEPCHVVYASGLTTSPCAKLHSGSSATTCISATMIA